MWTLVLVKTFLPLAAPKETKVPAEPPKPSTILCKLFDGPAGGAVEELRTSKAPPFLVTPYIPKDEEGNPLAENIVINMYGQQQVKANYAFYQQITDTDYIYVRDMSEAEFQRARLTGEPPAITKQDE
jgi:hypothetical protein